MAAQQHGKPRESGKQRSMRIPLDYYKHPDLLERGKLWLAAGALLAALGWWASGLDWDFQHGGIRQSDRGRQRVSPGPVAVAHAAWEFKCDACHVPFTPISANSVFAPWRNQRGMSNERCASCHAGPVHHANERQTPSCTQCHREHLGREASLVSLPDSDCVKCHDNLASHVKPGSPRPVIEDVRDFDHDHPEFQAVREGQTMKDPGKLKFNHALHLAPGMVLASGGKPFVLAQISDPGTRARFRKPEQTDRDAVALDCRSCHRTEGSDLGLSRAGVPLAASLPARSSSDYMLPITYENQCRACHPLEVEVDSPVKPGTHRVTVRHRLQPGELHDSLEEAYAARFLTSPESLAPDNRPNRRLPSADPSQRQREREALVDFVYQAEQILYLGKQTCGECHLFSTRDGRIQPDQIAPGSSPTFQVLPPSVPQIWFTHALFDHGAHRAVSCRECHAGAYPDGLTSTGVKVREASSVSEDVLVPGIATCRQCHAPLRSSGGLTTGGARFDCTECHRYHDGDHPLAGLGASRRSALEELDIQRFLSGSAMKASGQSH
jgi:Cytochrome c7 and related cytochrome c